MFSIREILIGVLSISLMAKVIKIFTQTIETIFFKKIIVWFFNKKQQDVLFYKISFFNIVVFNLLARSPKDSLFTKKKETPQLLRFSQYYNCCVYTICVFCQLYLLYERDNLLIISIGCCLFRKLHYKKYSILFLFSEKVITFVVAKGFTFQSISVGLKSDRENREIRLQYPLL